MICLKEGDECRNKENVNCINEDNNNNNNNNNNNIVS